MPCYNLLFYGYISSLVEELLLIAKSGYNFKWCLHLRKIDVRAWWLLATASLTKQT